MKQQFNINRVLAALNWRWCVVTLLVFALLIKLGVWQMNRAQEKEQRLTHIASLIGNDFERLDVVLTQLTEAESQNDQPVSIIGNFDPNILILKDNQTFNGQLGYRVYQVFYHQDKQAVLVNLGWIAGSRNRGILPDIEPIQGQFTLKGHIRYIEKGIELVAQQYDLVTLPLRVQQIDIAKLSGLFSIQLLPFAIYLDKNEQVGYQKNWQPVVMPPEKHRGYAFQWFSLAIAWLVLMIVAAIKNNKKANI
ncbi:SURF1 family protein [Colwellia sp. MEBiC06753]